VSKKFDICIVGGCGHVGLPLGMAFADAGKQVVLYDINQTSVKNVNDAKLPFKENGGEALLKKVIKKGTLKASGDPEVVREADTVILVIGTPVDEHLNPKVHDIFGAVDDIIERLSDDQILIMRSTLYPGVTDKVYAYLQKRGKKTEVAFCPERIVEGHALSELHELPQIIAGCSDAATRRASTLFKLLTDKVITTRSRACQVIHEHLALHQFRYFQPVLHDCQCQWR
jgi:UDP-N-acetyl-D-mannosaminuronic acid dehydrogenase